MNRPSTSGPQGKEGIEVLGGHYSGPEGRSDPVDLAAAVAAAAAAAAAAAVAAAVAAAAELETCRFCQNL